MGVEVIAQLNPMSEPLGHSVGNALEVQEAIDTLQGQGPPDLAEITLGDLYRHMELVLPVAESNAIPEPGHGDEGLREALHEIAESSGPVLERSLKSLLTPRAATRNGP